MTIDQSLLGPGKNTQIDSRHHIEFSGVFRPNYYVRVDFDKQTLSYRFLNSREVAEAQVYGLGGEINLQEKDYRQLIDLTKAVWSSEKPFTLGFLQQEVLLLNITIRDGIYFREIRIDRLDFSGDTRRLYDFVYSLIPKKSR